MPIDEGDEYIRIRVRDPDDFVDSSFRTVTISEEKGITSVMGKLKSDPNGSMVVQNFMFKKSKGWNAEKAQAWVKEHKDSMLVPETRMESYFQRRFIPASQFRVVEEDKKPKIVGYAALFDTFSEDMWGFREKVAPGAFAESLKRKDDVRMLFNHDPNFVIARTTNGTLKLSEDKRGLYFEGIPADTQWEKDLITKIKRGDISQNSFGFTIDEEDWDKRENVRTLTRVTLFDVSPVTYPAYKDTEVHIRWRFGETTLPIKLAKEKIDELIKREDEDPMVLMNRYGLTPNIYSAGPLNPTGVLLTGDNKETKPVDIIEPDKNWIDPDRWIDIQEKLRRNLK